MSEPTKVKLKTPIQVDGVEIREIAVRRPHAGALEKFQNNPKTGTALVILVSDLSDLTPDQVRSLDGEDFAIVAEVATGSLPNPSRT